MSNKSDHMTKKTIVPPSPSGIGSGGHSGETLHQDIIIPLVNQTLFAHDIDLGTLVLLSIDPNDTSRIIASSNEYGFLGYIDPQYTPEVFELVQNGPIERTTVYSTTTLEEKIIVEDICITC